MMPSQQTDLMRLCDWCRRNAAMTEDIYGLMCRCEINECDAVFCGASCADFHMGKHEDYGDCVRDRNGEIIRAWRRLV